MQKQIEYWTSPGVCCQLISVLSLWLKLFKIPKLKQHEFFAVPVYLSFIYEILSLNEQQIFKEVAIFGTLGLIFKRWYR
ncbi:hypothetical protein BpHYR1_047246 [Brachionus plicatilis]|uniref:Uncharacterized protein n=1 Tax=Brachionus plicatilis TaxID=10195 RepID=A0A3M7Q3Q3_BRAPC|nr:hypothetical protein BpHYR1_047246 [Brachionus plicatilis]